MRRSQGSGTGKDFFTIKYNSAGTQLWVATYNGSGTGNDIAVGLTVDLSGNVYTVGRSTNASGNFDYKVIKYNAVGTQQWVYTYNGTAGGDDRPRSIVLCDSNRVYVTGYTTSTSVQKDITTIRINSITGTADWVKTINGSSNSNDEEQMVIMDGYDPVIVGHIVNSGSNKNYYIAELNHLNGNISWSTTYDGFGYDDVAYSIARNDSGQFGVTGLVLNTTYEYHTVIYSPSGTQLVVNRYNTAMTAPNIAPKISVDTIANYFYVVGETNNGTANIDVVAYQVNSIGTQGWNFTYNGEGDSTDVGIDIAVNSFAQVFIVAQTGNASGYIDMTTFRISQTPVYWPPDLTDEPADENFWYYPNRGQVVSDSNTLVPQVKFYAPDGTNHFIKDDGISFVFYDTIGTVDTLYRTDLTFQESSQYAQGYQVEYSGFYGNFYLAHTGTTGATNVYGSKRLLFPNFYPGVDLHYYSNEKGLKYYFVVRPGYDPAIIQHLFSGAGSVGLDGSGNLEITTPAGNYVFGHPAAYQVDLSQTLVDLGPGDWNNIGTDLYNFALPSYDPTLPLVIMVSKGTASSATSAPPIQNLCWSTYFGSNLLNQFHDMERTSGGYLYMAGTTQNSFSLVYNSSPIAPYSSGEDFLLTKFSKTDSLKWFTIYGGNSTESNARVGLKSNGNVVLSGTSFGGGMPLPVTGTPFHDNTGVNNEFVISEFDGSTGGLIYGTLYGGSGSEIANDLIVKNDNIYIL